MRSSWPQTPSQQAMEPRWRRCLRVAVSEPPQCRPDLVRFIFISIIYREKSRGKTQESPGRKWKFAAFTSFKVWSSLFISNLLKAKNSTDGDDDDQLKNTEWMAKIEMSTYDGPARRLWMGPQFKFTSMAPSTNTQLDFQRSPSSAILQSEESMKTRVSAPLPITRFEI